MSSDAVGDISNSEQDAVIHNVPHLEQASSWDCGLTCLRMVLPSNLAENFHQNARTICAEEYQHQSTWTIDLCYVLHHYCVKQKYFTKTIGINPTFSTEYFYTGFISKDESRVNLRFKEAHSKGIPIETQMLSFAELLIHLERGGLAIVLADANLLMCQTCRSLRHNLGNMVKSLLHAKLPFIGHYVVVCGFDRGKKLVYYKDPAVSKDMCCVSFTAFEKARNAHGTDGDVILVYR